MFTNFLKTAFRNIKKNPLFSTIHILGLAISIAACVMILNYVRYERSYDSFIPDSDRIYRLRYERISEDGSAVRFASCAPPAATRIRGNYPEIESIGKLFQYQNVVAKGTQKFMEERMFFAEPQFLEILNIQTVSGQNTLNEPNQMLVSRSIARKYYGEQDPIGQTLKVNGKVDYKIVGMFEDRPQNTHLKMDILLSFENLLDIYGDDYHQSWGQTGMYTYVLLKKGADTKALENKFIDMVNQENPWLAEYKMTMLLPLQPVQAIHLTSHFMQEYEINSNADTLRILEIVAFFIMVMAWVNYINLSTARALTRAREIGVRKVVGAFRMHLIGQFLTETALMKLVAIILGAGLVELTAPFFRQLTGVVDLHMWTPQTLLLLAAIFGVGLVVAGGYPALALSSFQPIKILRGRLGAIPKKMDLRKALVIFQFIMALAMLTGTFTVYQQIRHMRNQNLGFRVDQQLIVKGPRVRQSDFDEKVLTFKKELAAIPGITQAAILTEVPGRQIYWDAGGIRRAGTDISQDKNYQIVGIDEDFLKTFDVDLLAGRMFSTDFGTEDKNLILNETATRHMGFETPESALNQQVDYWDEIYTIVGIFKDYHQQSPKAAFEPHIYRYTPKGRGRLLHFAAHVDHDVQGVIKTVEARYNQFFPGNPFEFYFLDDYFNQQYKSDEQFGRVFELFAFLAIFITSLGILGLSAFMATQRIKEIGIRKVMGANMKQLTVALSKEFVWLLMIAFVISTPLLIFGIRKWLTNFAVQMPMTVWLFVPSLVIVFGITALTMSAHLVKSVRANPIKALRYE